MLSRPIPVDLIALDLKVTGKYQRRICAVDLPVDKVVTYLIPEAFNHITSSIRRTAHRSVA
jgi:hypothetical protein